MSETRRRSGPRPRGALLAAAALALAGCAAAQQASSGSPGASSSMATSATPGATSSAMTGPGMFTTLDALASAQPASQAYRAFLQLPSMEAGTYRLDPGATDAQDTHQRDELYVVLAGTATLEVDGTKQAVAPGSMAWVRAGVRHRFSGLADGLRVLVIFASAPTSASDPGWMVVSRDDLVAAAANPSRNVWSPFLATSTMTAGLYLLAASVGGDHPQTHATDELNLTFSGSGDFVVDGSAPESIGPGSVMTVKAGHGHAFANLSADIVDLIVWPAA